MSDFNIDSISDSGAPNITFEFRGDTCKASLVGARLYVEVCGDAEEPSARMSLHDSSGELLADLIVLPRFHRNLTENVLDIGSALLWSHWRFVTAGEIRGFGPKQPPTGSGSDATA